jgi:hypothetical protein
MIVFFFHVSITKKSTGVPFMICHITVFHMCAIFMLYWMCVQVNVVVILAHNQDVRCELFCQFQVQFLECMVWSVCVNFDAQCGNISQSELFTYLNY